MSRFYYILNKDFLIEDIAAFTESSFKNKKISKSKNKSEIEKAFRGKSNSEIEIILRNKIISVIEKSYIDIKLISFEGEKIVFDTERDLSSYLAFKDFELKTFNGDTITTLESLCSFLNSSTESDSRKVIIAKAIEKNNWREDLSNNIIAEICSSDENSKQCKEYFKKWIIQEENGTYKIKSNNRIGHCYYSNTIKSFISQPPREILGELSKSSKEYNYTRGSQTETWENEVNLLKRILFDLDNQFKKGQIIFEYTISRIGTRIDVVLLIQGVVFILEFKDGAKSFNAQDKEQTMGYLRDLRHFHEKSSECKIIPILIATKSDITFEEDKNTVFEENGKKQCLYLTNGQDDNLIKIINQEVESSKECADDWAVEWQNAQYKACPSIISATVDLFNNHHVKDIANHDSGENLTITCNYINKLIPEIKKAKKKAICFVTGVPGAGKTLVGLSVVSNQYSQEEQEQAVFLSGNAPLVNVLRESLARDRCQREDLSTGKNMTKALSKDAVKPFIQNVHHYRDSMLAKTEKSDKDIRLKDGAKPEIEHIAIFDEAQRAWTQDKLQDFLKTHNHKDLADDFPFSEPGYLLWSMNHHEWAVVVCLVGGGQEINDGEAGIGEWLKAIKDHFPQWEVHIPEASVKEFQNYIEEIPHLKPKEELYLNNCQRSARTPKVAEFINKILDRDTQKAKELYSEINTKFPLYITRDVKKAKLWLQSQIKDLDLRCGLLVSSRGRRVNALGYNIQSVMDGPGWYINWFLNDKKDVRSSSFLEVVGTEFIVQGLELDYIGFIWESDFRYSENGWEQYSWGSDNWQVIGGKNPSKDEETQKKIKEDKVKQINAYRVLLTRARLGLVIIVPEGYKKGDSLIEDETLSPKFYDCTYNYLKGIGLKEVPDILTDYL